MKAQSNTFVKVRRQRYNKALGIYIVSVTLVLVAYSVVTAAQYL